MGHTRSELHTTLLLNQSYLPSSLQSNQPTNQPTTTKGVCWRRPSQERIRTTPTHPLLSMASQAFATMRLSSSSSCSSRQAGTATVPAMTRRRLGHRASMRTVALAQAETEAAAAGTSTDEAGEEEEQAPKVPDPVPSESEGWIGALRLADIPKGKRKETTVSGYSMVVFWYKQELFAIEPRSPAEGAYSEGMSTAKLTQDGGIVCPSTESVFDIKTGAVREFYPTNAVLRAITPTCRPMDTFPVTVANDVVYVKVPVSADGQGVRSTTSGGSNTSVEQNNVYAVEPRVYIEGQDPGEAINDDMKAKMNLDPTQLVLGVVGVALISIGGTAYTLIKLESVKALAAFWAIFMTATAGFVIKATNLEDDIKDN